MGFVESSAQGSAVVVTDLELVTMALDIGRVASKALYVCYELELSIVTKARFANSRW
jgi:hypothetical protein